jgi:hypothetical protein
VAAPVGVTGALVLLLGAPHPAVLVLSAAAALALALSVLSHPAYHAAFHLALHLGVLEFWRGTCGLPPLVSASTLLGVGFRVAALRVARLGLPRHDDFEVAVDVAMALANLAVAARVLPYPPQAGPRDPWLQAQYLTEMTYYAWALAQDLYRAPPGSRGGRAPSGSSGGRAPPGSRGGRARSGSSGGRAPPGSRGGRAPSGSSKDRVRLTPSIVAHHVLMLALLAGCYCVRRGDVDRLMCLGMLLTSPTTPLLSIARKLRHDGAQMHALVAFSLFAALFLALRVVAYPALLLRDTLGRRGEVPDWIYYPGNAMLLAVWLLQLYWLQQIAGVLRRGGRGG